MHLLCGAGPIALKSWNGSADTDRMRWLMTVVVAVVCVACDENAYVAEPTDEPVADSAVGPSVQPQPDAGAVIGDAGAQTADAGPVAPQEDAAVVDAAIVPVADAGPVDVSPAPCTALYYRDVDGDGYGDPATGLVSCAKPDGYVADKSDCYDANGLAKPGQGGRFTEHRGDGSFDYNCDGVSKPLYDKVAVVPDLTGISCPPPSQQTPETACDYEPIRQAAAQTEGWYQNVAACGTRELWGAGCSLKWLADSHTWICKAYAFTPGVSDKTQLCN